MSEYIVKVRAMQDLTPSAHYRSYYWDDISYDKTDLSDLSSIDSFIKTWLQGLIQYNNLKKLQPRRINGITYLYNYKLVSPFVVTMQFYTRGTHVLQVMGEINLNSKTADLEFKGYNGAFQFPDYNNNGRNLSFKL